MNNKCDECRYCVRISKILYCANKDMPDRVFVSHDTDACCLFEPVEESLIVMRHGMRPMELTSYAELHLILKYLDDEPVSDLVTVHDGRKGESMTGTAFNLLNKLTGGGV